jgi:hypothetical protein
MSAPGQKRRHGPTPSLDRCTFNCGNSERWPNTEGWPRRLPARRLVEQGNQATPAQLIEHVDGSLAAAIERGSVLNRNVPRVVSAAAPDLDPDLHGLTAPHGVDPPAPNIPR